MFRLLDSGLPKDPSFPANLEKLGYFINEEDEIRSINDPRAYFNYFLSKNERYNVAQRESMNTVIRQLVLDRIHAQGLKTERLPLGTPATEPHIPILVSNDLATKKRVIVLFYEHSQDLGVLAHRVIGGRGGVNAGSAVDLIKSIQALSSSPDDQDSPGIILANMGQLRWYRRGARALTQLSWYSLPAKSAVHGALRFDPIRNTVQGNRTTAEHVGSIFYQAVAILAHPQAKLDIIGVSDGAVQVVKFLNQEQNWRTWGERINVVALLASYHSQLDITNPDFAQWLRKRGRAYTVSEEAADTPLAGSDGTRKCRGYGCPSYSIGEPYYSEMMLPRGKDTLVSWLQKVAMDPEYKNEEIVIYGDDDELIDDGSYPLDLEEAKKWQAANDAGDVAWEEAKKKNGKGTVEGKEDPTGEEKGVLKPEISITEVTESVQQALKGAMESVQPEKNT